MLGVQDGVQDHGELLILHVAVVQMDAEQVVLCLDIPLDHRRERLAVAEAQRLAKEVHGVVVEALEDREGQKALRLAMHEELGLLGGRLVVAGDLLLCFVVESVVCFDVVEEILLVDCLIRLVRPLRRHFEAVCCHLDVGCSGLEHLEARWALCRDDGPDQMLHVLHPLPVGVRHVDVLILLA